jgi:hypothetical protein
MALLRSASCALATVALTGVAGGAAPAGATARAVPSCSEPAEFNAVAVVSPSFAWAVGNCWNGSNAQALIERWNGKHWRIVPRLDPGGASARVQYDGVAALSAADAWAVGFSANGVTALPVIAHWNGKRWALVPRPEPSGGAVLTAVTALSSSDVWAVGSQFNGTAQQTMIMHWNGSHWRIVRSPNPGGPVNGDSLDGVAGSSPRSVWAVGRYFTGTTTNCLILRWTGKKWRQVACPHPAGSHLASLTGVAALSGSDAWAAGTAEAGANTTLIEHWNGKRWALTRSPNPNPKNSGLSGIVAVSGRSAWAVGSYGVGQLTANDTLILRWNGKSWRQVASPSPGGAGSANLLDGIAAGPGGQLWAVGCYTPGQTNCRTLALRDSPAGWLHVASAP